MLCGRGGGVAVRRAVLRATGCLPCPHASYCPTWTSWRPLASKQCCRPWQRGGRWRGRGVRGGASAAVGGGASSSRLRACCDVLARLLLDCCSTAARTSKQRQHFNPPSPHMPACDASCDLPIVSHHVYKSTGSCAAVAVAVAEPGRAEPGWSRRRVGWGRWAVEPRAP